MAFPAPPIFAVYVQDAASAAITPGLAVAQYPGRGTVQLGTSTILAVGGDNFLGLAIQGYGAAPNALVCQRTGPVDPGLVNLGAGTAGNVGVSSTGALQRYVSGPIVGTCDQYGNVLLTLMTVADAPGYATSGGIYKARNVVTSLAAYTGSGTGTLTASANGVFGAQDGVTNVAGDIVFIQAGTTNLTGALDSGPWELTTVGTAGTKYVLSRPDWWLNGNTVVQGAVIDIGGEGTVFAGTQWKSFAATAQVVGTNDPVFYCGRLTQTAVLSAGSIAVSNVGVRSLAKSQFTASLNTVGGTLTGTVGYGVLPNVTALVAGYANTASITFKAIATADAIQNTDTSTINVTIINW